MDVSYSQRMKTSFRFMGKIFIIDLDLRTLMFAKAQRQMQVPYVTLLPLSIP